jgi:plastocyanin
MKRDEVMHLIRLRAVLAAFCFGVSACAGVNYPTSATGTAVTINVVAINGGQSYSPNPASVPAGQLVVWHNIDKETHRVVLDDRSVDTGNLAPGASSAPMPIGTAGPYHCTIHPEMVGTITR